MRSSTALTELLNQQRATKEDGYSPFRVEVIGLERLVFVREVDKPNPMYADGKDELHYVVETIPKRNKVRLVISKVNQSNPHESEVLAKDAGDLWGMTMRKRLVKQVYKRDWQVSDLVEKDLEKLATQIPYYIRERARILLESIITGDNEERKERLLKIEQGQHEFPPKTLELLAFIHALPAVAPENEPCHARFTLQHLAGKKGNTIDAVRHRFTPLQGQPFIKVVQEGRGNQPTIYCYLPSKRSTGTEVQREATITSDTEIVAAPKGAASTRRESKELLRYGGKPKEWSH